VSESRDTESELEEQRFYTLNTRSEGQRSFEVAGHEIYHKMASMLSQSKPTYSGESKIGNITALNIVAILEFILGNFRSLVFGMLHRQ
jgi:hypothetical protein